MHNVTGAVFGPVVYQHYFKPIRILPFEARQQPWKHCFMISRRDNDTYAPALNFRLDGHNMSLGNQRKQASEKEREVK